MSEPDRTLGIYLHLSRASHLRQQPMIRDKLLVLAGVQSEEMGLDQISALCRHKILVHNSRHLVGQWPTFASALGDEQFQSYLKQLRRRYSAEKSEHMLDALGIELGRERDAYFSDLEYAAALLDTKPEEIAAILANSPLIDGSPPAGSERSDRTEADRTQPAGDGSRASRALLNLLVVSALVIVAGLVLIALAIVASAVLG